MQKNHHYISVGYLNNFWSIDPYKSTTNTSKRWHYYDLNKKKISEKNTNKIFSEKYLFSNVLLNWEKEVSMEIFFWSQESKFLKIIKTLEKNITRIKEWEIKWMELCQNKTNELMWLLIFFIKRLLLVKFLKWKSSSLILKKSELNNENLLKLNSENLSSVDPILLSFSMNSSEDHKAFLYNQLFEKVCWKKIIDLLVSKQWEICYTLNNDLTFITGDFPFYFAWRYTDIASVLIDPDFKIIFPLTKNILLVIWWEPKGNDNLTYKEIKEEAFVIAMNSYIALNCDEWIFWYDQKVLLKTVNELKKNKDLPNSFYQLNTNNMNLIDNYIIMN